jgi:hypothetical protein
MALPTVLTAAQVGGSADATELPVQFNTGANRGLTLMVALSDVNIPPSVADGSITVPNPGVYTRAITSIEPATWAADEEEDVLVNGSGFVSGDVVSFNDTDMATTFVSSTQLSVNIPADTEAAGPYPVVVANAAGTVTSNAVTATLT